MNVALDGSPQGARKVVQKEVETSVKLGTWFRSPSTPYKKYNQMEMFYGSSMLQWEKQQPMMMVMYIPVYIRVYISSYFYDSVVFGILLL